MLGLCAQGMDNVRIARRLGMSVGTVRKHLENTFVRLGVSSRGQAVAAVHPDLTWV
jgi:DNA-binding CsgD family transcriptional regulator